MKAALERRVRKSLDEHYDPETGRQVVKVVSGTWHVSTNEQEILATVLGSCIAACIHDPVARIGGMNHFLLPGEQDMDIKLGEAARYGVFAMESLVNGILKAGGRKERLEVKVFGGGNVIKSSARIGSKNAEFIRSFLHNEGLPIISHDLEGDLPRRVHYYPDTGKVLMRRLQRKEDMQVVKEEERYRKSISRAPVEGNIDLF